jgi:hypothetical protein
VEPTIRATSKFKIDVYTVVQMISNARQDLRPQNLGQQDLAWPLVQGMRGLVTQVLILQQSLESMRTQGNEARVVVNDFLKVMGDPVSISIAKDILGLRWMQPGQSRELPEMMKQLKEIRRVIFGCLSLPETTDRGCFPLTPHPHIQSDIIILQREIVAKFTGETFTTRQVLVAASTFGTAHSAGAERQTHSGVVVFGRPCSFQMSVR